MTILQELMRRGKKSRRYIPRTTNVLLNFVFQKNAFAYTSHFFYFFLWLYMMVTSSCKDIIKVHKVIIIFYECFNVGRGIAIYQIQM